MWALDTLIASASLAQTHDRAPASVFATLGLGAPKAAFAVVLVMRVAAAGAAADGEEPEESCDDGEGCCDPGDCEGAGADVDFDVVRVKEGVEGAA